MALAEISDLKRLLDADPLKGQVRIEIGDTGHLSESDAQAYLDAMEGYIAARLGWTAQATKLMKMVHASITAYRVWLHLINRSRGLGEIPSYIEEWNRWAEDTLDVIKLNPPEEEIPDDSLIDITTLSSNIHETEDEEVTVQTNDWIQLSHAPALIRSETVCSEKDGGGTLFARGVDYLVNYKTGEIKGLGAGIANLQKIYISYVHVTKGRMRWSRHREDWASQRPFDKIIGLDPEDYTRGLGTN